MISRESERLISAKPRDKTVRRSLLPEERLIVGLLASWNSSIACRASGRSGGRGDEDTLDMMSRASRCCLDTVFDMSIIHCGCSGTAVDLLTVSVSPATMRKLFTCAEQLGSIVIWEYGSTVNVQTLL